jgi:hypothetical protein
MPSRSAMARAVAGWSPVIITGTMPARWHFADGLRGLGRGGSIRPTSPSNNRSLLLHRVKRCRAGSWTRSGASRTRARAGRARPSLGVGAALRLGVEGRIGPRR